MVTAVNDVGLRAIILYHACFAQKTHFRNIKIVWFSGAWEPIEMKFIQMIEPLSQFITEICC